MSSSSSVTSSSSSSRPPSSLQPLKRASARPRRFASSVTGDFAAGIDEAELLYRKSCKHLSTTRRSSSKDPQQQPLMDRMKCELFLSMKKSKTVRDTLRQWWLFKRVINMSPKQQQDAILSLALASHYLTNYNRRAMKLQNELHKILAMVVVPFMLPPAVVFGIPALILLLPVFMLIWVIITLNRRAKQVLFQNARVDRRRPRSFFNSMMIGTTGSHDTASCSGTSSANKKTSRSKMLRAPAAADKTSSSSVPDSVSRSSSRASGTHSPGRSKSWLFRLHVKSAIVATASASSNIKRKRAD